MHCAKNLLENILKTTLEEKETSAVRTDMQAQGIRPHLYMQPLPTNQRRLFMSDASYVLSAEDKAKVFKVLKDLRTPTNYVFALHTNFFEGKLSGLKSHDFHVLLQ